jgi:hypothetical protein
VEGVRESHRFEVIAWEQSNGLNLTRIPTGEIAVEYAVDLVCHHQKRYVGAPV